MPMDPIDFEPRPWVAWSGWPIGPQDLAPYWAPAGDWAEAGSAFGAVGAKGGITAMDATGETSGWAAREEAAGLGAYDAAQLAASRELADYFEEAAGVAGDAKTAANWVLSELLARLNRDGLEVTASPVPAASLGALIARIHDNTISGKIAKTVFEAMWAGEGEPDAIIDARGLRQVADSGAIAQLVDAALAANAGQVEQYRATPADKRQRMFGFFVGQVMKASQGKANPQQVNDLLRERLDGE
jgi:aspartyl-tRNA(Asn)/glutamyl-tRNA(Gln) amidotransferase subunit B